MKKTKQLLAILLAFIIVIPSAIPISALAEEIPSEQRDLTKRMGLKPFEIHYISEDNLQKDYTYEKKILGSSSYGTGENREWAEYSTWFYYNQMTEDEQSFYDRLMDECLMYLTSGGDIYYDGGYYLPGIYYGDIGQERAINLYYIFYYSNPEFYYLMNGLRYSSSNQIYPMVYDAFADEESRKSTTAGIKSVLSSYESAARSYSSEYDMVKAIHDKLCDTVTYNNEAANDQQPEQQSFSQSIYSALILEDTVCAGYSSVFEMICNKLGIDSIKEVSEGHAWNRVSVDDIWYVIDCTWDDRDDTAGKFYKFFLRSYSQTRANDQNNAHITKSFLVPFLPSCTMDCTPSYDNFTPGTLPVITETAMAPELVEYNGSFVLSAESDARIYYTVDGSIPAEGQRKSDKYETEVWAQSGTVVKAYAVVDPKKNSEVKSWVLGSGETPTPEPTLPPTPTVTPEPTLPPMPTVTPEPTLPPTPTVTPEPTLVPTPTVTPEPTLVPTPTVTPTPIESIRIVPSSLTLEVGYYSFLNIEPAQYNGDAEWSSSNTSVAVVNYGRVEGISPGTAEITARVGNALATATVTVVNPEVEPDVKINVGKKLKLRFPKKVKRVVVTNKYVLKVTKIKGKIVTVKGLDKGTVTVYGYNKKGKLIGRAVIQVK